MGQDRCGPSAFQCGEAERLLPVARPSAENPSSPKVYASQARDGIRTSVLGLPTRPPLHVPSPAPPPGRNRRWPCIPAQVIGCMRLQGAVCRARPRVRRPAGRRHGAVGNLPSPEYLGHPWPAPAPAGPDRRAPGQDLGLAQQGAAPSMLSQCAQRAIDSEAELDGPTPGVAVVGQVRREPGGPGRKRPPPRGTRLGHRPWRRPAGSR